MEKIRRRFAQLLWEENTLNLLEAEEWYQNMVWSEEFGGWHWEDIDDTDQTPSFWAAVGHCQRLERILKSFGEARLLHDAEYSGKLVGGLKYWLVHDFQNPNWWHNEIGTPQRIGNLVLLLYPVLDECTVLRAAEVVGRGSMACNEGILGRWTGANLIWGMLNTVRTP